MNNFKKILTVVQEVNKKADACLKYKEVQENQVYNGFQNLKPLLTKIVKKAEDEKLYPELTEESLTDFGITLTELRKKVCALHKENFPGVFKTESFNTKHELEARVKTSENCFEKDILSFNVSVIDCVFALHALGVYINWVLTKPAYWDQNSIKDSNPSPAPDCEI